MFISIALALNTFIALGYYFFLEKNPTHAFDVFLVLTVMACVADYQDRRR